MTFINVSPVIRGSVCEHRHTRAARPNGSSTPAALTIGGAAAGSHRDAVNRPSPVCQTCRNILSHAEFTMASCARIRLSIRRSKSGRPHAGCSAAPGVFRHRLNPFRHVRKCVGRSRDGRPAPPSNETGPSFHSRVPLPGGATKENRYGEKAIAVVQRPAPSTRSNANQSVLWIG
jgi:hypothetical protein